MEQFKKPRFLVFKYLDAVITQQWDYIYDGEWNYGEDVFEKVFERNYNFYSK